MDVKDHLIVSKATTDEIVQSLIFMLIKKGICTGKELEQMIELVKAMERLKDNA